jgi:vitamin B12 transporter
MIALTLIAAAAPLAFEPDQQIVVTASREPVKADDTAVSVSLFDRQAIEALSLPLASDLFRLAPGISVASTGPRGTQTQVRIRGAEANHTLLFVDGIRFNDPASGNEARFELLATDLLSRIEVVRGPQSALWGSEALGGVIAVDTGGEPGSRLAALGEYGSLENVRGSGQFRYASGRVHPLRQRQLHSQRTVSTASGPVARETGSRTRRGASRPSSAPRRAANWVWSAIMSRVEASLTALTR